MLKLAQLLKSDYGTLSAREVLQANPAVLLGVTEPIEQLLAKLQLFTVFDLAHSKIFNAAYNITTGAEGGDSALARHGFATSDTIKNSERMTPLEEVPALDLEILDGIGDSLREEISQTLGIENIRDLGYWPPFMVAKKVVSLAFGIDEFEDDPDAPAELLPTAGDYPTERVYYQKIFLDNLSEEPDKPMQFNPDLLDSIEEVRGNIGGILSKASGTLSKAYETKPTSKPEVDLGPVTDFIVDTLENLRNQVDVGNLDVNKGFSKPAFGALTTFEQSWYTQGLSLGQLLHSLALAPAESTKIAMIDWSRRTSTAQQEGTSQTESLANVTAQSRAIEEITNGVASEVQYGRSTVDSRSSAKTKGKSSGLITSFVDDVTLGLTGIGGTSGRGSNTSNVSTVSSSNGRRQITGELLQDISASTQQFATSARNRRASVIREASQEESEEVKTRIITNYNHSHALSIHYYEVVQIYRTLMRLKKVERCIFIPMKVLDFSDERLLVRYRRVLMEAALNDLTRRLLLKANGKVVLKKHEEFYLNGNRLSSLDANSRLTKITVFDAKFDVLAFHVKLRNSTEVIEVVPNEQGIAEIDAVPKIETIESILIRYEGAVDAGFDWISLRLHLEKADSQIRFQNEATAIDAEFVVPHNNNSTNEPITQELFSVELPAQNSVLAELLNEEALYYSQAIWSSLPPEYIVLLLSGYYHHGKRVVEYIDPEPLATYGNYVAFRYFHGDDQEEAQDEQWEKWLKKHVDFATLKEELIPVPTGGVFAESVLGRFNGSEKLDITRFWDWQSSPIPESAPDIAPIGVGSRGTTDDISTGALAPSVVNIQPPQAMPDPTGFNATMSALASSNLFRDMSGLAQAAALAQTGIAESTTGALAGQFTAATLESQRMQMIGDFAKSFFAADAAKSDNGVGSKNPSFTGALLNHARKLSNMPGTAGNGGSSFQPGSGGTPASSGGGQSSGAAGGQTSSLESQLLKRAAGEPSSAWAEDFGRVVNKFGLADNTMGDTASDFDMMPPVYDEEEEEWTGPPAFRVTEVYESYPVNKFEHVHFKHISGAFYEKITVKEITLSDFDTNRADLQSEHEQALDQLSEEVLSLIQTPPDPQYVPFVSGITNSQGQPGVFPVSAVFKSPDLKSSDRNNMKIMKGLYTESKAEKLLEDKIGLAYITRDGNIPAGAMELHGGYRYGYIQDESTLIPIEIRIEGNASQTGGEEGNVVLSQQRASAVRDYLVNEKGLRDGLKLTNHFDNGSSRPLVNAPNQDKSLNRNAIITVIIRERYCCIGSPWELDEMLKQELLEIKASYESSVTDDEFRLMLKDRYGVDLPLQRAWGVFVYQANRVQNYEAFKRFAKYKYNIGLRAHQLVNRVGPEQLIRVQKESERLDVFIRDKYNGQFFDQKADRYFEFPLYVVLSRPGLHVVPAERWKEGIFQKAQLDAASRSVLARQGNYKVRIEHIKNSQNRAKESLIFRYTHNLAPAIGQYAFEQWAVEWYGLPSGEHNKVVGNSEFVAPYFIEDLEFYKKADDIEKSELRQFTPMSSGSDGWTVPEGADEDEAE